MPAKPDAAPRAIRSSTVPVLPVSYTIRPGCSPTATCGTFTHAAQKGDNCELTLGGHYRGHSITLLYTTCPPGLPYDYEIFPADSKQSQPINSLVGTVRWLVKVTVAGVTQDTTACHIRGTLLDPYWVSYYMGGVQDFGVTVSSKRDCARLHVGTTAALPNMWYAPIGNKQQWTSSTPNPGWHVAVQS